MKDDYICPVPRKWNAIYNTLVEAWESGGRTPGDKPPVPLILEAWHYSSDLEKRIRWEETRQWAETHQCIDLIPELKENEKFRG